MTDDKKGVNFTVPAGIADEHLLTAWRTVLRNDWQLYNLPRITRWSCFVEAYTEFIDAFKSLLCFGQDKYQPFRTHKSICESLTRWLNESK